MNCTACENSAHSPEDNLPLPPLMPARLCDIFPLHKSLPWLRGRSGKQPLGETVPEKPAYQARGIFSLRYKASKGLILIATARGFLAPSSAKKRDYGNHAGEKCLKKTWRICLGSILRQLCYHKEVKGNACHLHMLFVQWIVPCSKQARGDATLYREGIMESTQQELPALLLQVGPCMPMVHTLPTVLQTAVGWPVIASRAHAKVWNPLTNPEILSCKWSYIKGTWKTT